MTTAYPPSSETLGIKLRYWQARNKKLKLSNKEKYKRGKRILIAIISLGLLTIIGGYFGCNYMANSFADSVKDSAEKIRSNKQKETENKKAIPLKPELYLFGSEEIKTISNNEISYKGNVIKISEIKNLKIKPGKIEDANFEAFPLEVFKFKELEYLWIGMRGFKEIPIGLGELKKLKSIDIQHGSIEKLPYDIIQLQNLESLNLLWSNITELPPNFHKLEKLKYLHLGCTQLEEVSPVLLKMKGLETLILSHDDECQEKREVFNEFETERIRKELQNTKIHCGRKKASQ